MWSPTHIQVTVQRAKGLLVKGKNGTNNCFVTIGLGKEKYQTSVKEKAEPSVNWNEECELKIPDQGNRAELVLTCLHRNNIGIDEFLGQVTLPLNEMDVYDRPRSKWFRLESKPGKEKKNKERGELEARIAFIVKSGSLTDLSKKDKHKSSIGQLATSVGGSLLSIGTIEKRKGLKKFAKSLGSKVHLPGKKKPKEGDDLSFSGSFASIDTPSSSNGGSRRFGQRPGDSDPGVISEDEDEFVFDNLSHKSSGSSLNLRSGGLQPPAQNYAPRHPSPLLGFKGGKGGGKQQAIDRDFSAADEAELERLENDFSARARTLPAPSKPPRTQQPSAGEQADIPQLSEWEAKLYGKHMEIGSSDSLKRRSWEATRVPLTSHEEELKTAHGDEGTIRVQNEVEKDAILLEKETSSGTGTIDSSSESDAAEEKIPSTSVKEASAPEPSKPKQLDLSPEPKSDFDHFNASFAKFEQKNSAKIFDPESKKARNTQAFIENEALKEEPSAGSPPPVALPRNIRDKEAEQQKAAEERKKEEKAEQEEAKKRKEKEDEAKLKEERKREKEAQLQEQEKKRDAKRLYEDQRILNFVKRSTSVEESDEGFTTPPKHGSPNERHSSEKKEKRFSKFRYFNKRDDGSLSPSPKSSERIIIGHKQSSTHAERRSEITAALAKKYDGKTREELMLIANGMENEALLQRQRVKELEDYLDNLLLRVMETHPKILQNPYSRTTSAKSFKNYIEMNDFI